MIPMEGDTLILEINLISAQGLKLPSANPRRIQTYALVWVDSSMKLQTRVDRSGGENPTWNDRFLFRVSPDFIACETSAVTVETYAAGYIKDFLMGSVRLLLSNCLEKAITDVIGTPAFTAVQVRRPSGKFRGILNIAAAVYSNEDFPMFNGLSAISFCDLMGETAKDKESVQWRRRLSRGGSKRSDESSGGESCDFDLSSLDLSDGTESTTSSSSSSVASTALKEFNGLKKGMAGKLNVLKSDRGGLMCGLMLQRRICSCPSDRFWEEESVEENL